MRQTFRQEEAEQILREAVRRDMERQTSPLAEINMTPAVPRERLAEMAAELGISTAALEAVLSDKEAEAQRQREQEAEQQERQAFITKRRASFLSDLYAYFGVNGLLFVLNILLAHASHDREIWFIWPLLFWTAALYFHGINTLPTKGPVFERDFTAWQEKKKRRQTKDAKRQARIAARDRKRSARGIAEAELDEI